MTPLVTVFIPCYNQSVFISRALESVLQQDYPHLEIIIGDDASTDATADVIKPFLQDPRVRYERTPQNIGRVANYRRGIMNLAHGEWYINLDGDDYYDNPHYISSAVKMASEKKDCILIFGRQKYLDSSTGAITIKSAPNVKPWTPGKQFLLNYFSVGEGIPHMSALYRVDIARKADLFINDIVFADAEAMLRLLPWGWVGYCGEFSGVWVYHGKNDSHSLSVDLRLKNLTFITHPCDFFVAHHFLTLEESESWKRHGLTRIIREGLHFYLDHHAYRFAWEFWLRATTPSPSIPWNPIQRLWIWCHWRVLVRLIFPWFNLFKEWLRKIL